MRSGRYSLEDRSQPRAQAAKAHKPSLVGRKLSGIRELLVNEEESDLLEFASLSDVEDVVATVVQVVASPADRADCGIAGNDAGQGNGLLRLEAACGGSAVGHALRSRSRLKSSSSLRSYS